MAQLDQRQVLGKAQSVLLDDSHPMLHEFHLLPFFFVLCVKILCVLYVGIICMGLFYACMLQTNCPWGITKRLNEHTNGKLTCPM